MVIACKKSLIVRLTFVVMLLIVASVTNDLHAEVNLDPEQVVEGLDVPAFAESPKTLFLWNSSISPSGGPPSRDEPLASDRPDFTESSTTVGRGVAQVELGYTYISNVDGGVHTNSHSFPEMLWRIGMFADWFELRLGYNGGTGLVVAEPLGTFTASGSEELYLGAKLGLTLQQGFLPEMALVPQMAIPTGSSALTSGHVLPGVNWLYGWDITDWLSCGGSTQMNKAVDDSGAMYYEVAQSMTFGLGLTDRIGFYGEWFFLTHTAATQAHTEHYLDGGFTFSVNNDLQLDIRAGIGLSDASDNYFAGTGLVKRF